MAEDDGSAHGSGRARIARLIEQAYDLFMERLEEQAQANGGVIRQQELSTVRSHMAPERHPRLRSLVSQGWHDLALSAEESYWASQRNYPLERLLVHKFDHLMAPRGKPAVQSQTLSRRCIPAFLTALHEMVGEEVFQDYEARCRKILEVLREQHGEDFEWEMFYRDRNARTLATDILVYIAHYFGNMERRRKWMIDLFDTAMPPPSDERERQWVFGPLEFHMLMDALYGDLRRGLAEPKYSAALKKRYGTPNLAALETLIDNLAVDRRSVEATLASGYIT